MKLPRYKKLSVLPSEIELLYARFERVDYLEEKLRSVIHVRFRGAFLSFDAMHELASLHQVAVALFFLENGC